MTEKSCKWEHNIIYTKRITIVSNYFFAFVSFQIVHWRNAYGSWCRGKLLIWYYLLSWMALILELIHYLSWYHILTWRLHKVAWMLLIYWRYVSRQIVFNHVILFASNYKNWTWADMYQFTFQYLSGHSLHLLVDSYVVLEQLQSKNIDNTLRKIKHLKDVFNKSW